MKEFLPSQFFTSGFSFIKISHLAKQHIRIMPGRIDILERHLSSLFAGIVDHNIPKPEHPLPGACRNSHILYAPERDVPCISGQQPAIDLNCRVREIVSNKPLFQVVKRGYQK